MLFNERTFALWVSVVELLNSGFLAPLELLSRKCFVFSVASLIWNVVNLLTSSLSNQVSYFDTQINPKKHIPRLTENQKILGVLPILAYTWRVRPKGVPLLGFRYQERAGVSLVGLYQRVGNSVILSIKRPKGLTHAFHGCEKVE